MAQAWYATETVQSSQVTGTLTDFPALFSRTSAGGGGGVPDFRTIGNGGHVANANGYDLCLYTDTTLASMLKMETELYNAATGQVIKWGKVSSIATSTVRVWGYGDAGITTNQDDKTNVWTSSYQAVYHFRDGSTLSLLDSSSNANDGTEQGFFLSATTGQIDGAVAQGSSAYIATGATGFNFANTAAFTLSGWVYPNPPGAGFIYVQSIASSPVSTGWYIIYDINSGVWANNAVAFEYYDGANQKSRNTAASSVPIATYTYISIVVDTSNTSAGMVWYVNGSAVTGATRAGSQGTGGSAPNSINYSGLLHEYMARYGTSVFSGVLDEMRVASTDRTAAWVGAEYNNQYAPTSFWGIGTETAYTAGTTFTPAGTAATTTGGTPVLGLGLPAIGLALALVTGTPTLSIGTVRAPAGATLTTATGTPFMDFGYQPSAAASVTAGGVAKFDQGMSPAGAASATGVGTPSMGSGMLPAGASLTLTPGTPTVVYGLVLSPAGAALVSTGGTPFMDLGLFPGGVSTILTAGTPGLLVPGAFNPAGVALALVGGAPTLGFGLSPAAATLATVGGTPVVGLGLVPAGAAIVTVGGTPTLSTSAGVFYPTGAVLTLTTGTPSMLISGNIIIKVVSDSYAVTDISADSVAFPDVTGDSSQESM